MDLAAGVVRRPAGGYRKGRPGTVKGELSNSELSPTRRCDKPNKPLSVENPLDIGGKTPLPGEIPDGLAKLMTPRGGERAPKRDHAARCSSSPDGPRPTLNKGLNRRQIPLRLA
jgi:hypothetical protein